MAKIKAATRSAINIGISEKDRATIAGGLARLLADTYTLYLTTHNFHWNVTGPMFNTLHLMFMAQYTELWNGRPDRRADPLARSSRSRLVRAVRPPELDRGRPGDAAQGARDGGDPGRWARSGRPHRPQHLPARRPGERRADR